MCDDAAGGFSVGQRKHGIARAARFERRDFLQILALEEQTCANRLLERTAGQHGRSLDVLPDARMRAADRIEINLDRRSGDGGRAHRRQLPARPCTLGKNRSFHESGLTLIVPVLAMKSTYFM